MAFSQVNNWLGFFSNFIFIIPDIKIYPSAIYKKIRIIKADAFLGKTEGTWNIIGRYSSRRSWEFWLYIIWKFMSMHCWKHYLYVNKKYCIFGWKTACVLIKNLGYVYHINLGSTFLHFQIKAQNPTFKNLIHPSICPFFPTPICICHRCEWVNIGDIPIVSRTEISKYLQNTFMLLLESWGIMMSLFALHLNCLYTYLFFHPQSASAIPK